MPSLSDIIAQREQIEIKKAELELEKEKLRIKSDNLLLMRTLGDHGNGGRIIRRNKKTQSADERVLSFLVYFLGLILILGVGIFFAFKNNLLTNSDLQKLLYYDLSPKINSAINETKKVYNKVSDNLALEPVLDSTPTQKTQQQNQNQTHFYK